MRTFIISLILLTIAADAGAELIPGNLRTESLSNPVGVDVRQPRFSWQLTAPTDSHDQRQTAYRVIVASSRDKLGSDAADLWDSGKVASDESLLIGYAGKPLQSHRQYFWKLQAWDQDDKVGPWSEVATWSVGLLNAEDDFAAAQWIGFDKPRQSVDLPDAPFAGAKWIAFSGDKAMAAPKGMRVYMRDLLIPGDVPIKSAVAYVTADDRFWFVVNGENLATSNAGADSWKTAKSVDVTKQLKLGLNHLRAQVENGTDGPTGLLASVVVTRNDGQVMTFGTDAAWHATDNPGANWHNRDIAPDAWLPAKEIAKPGDAPWGPVKLQALVLPPPRVLRTTFNADKAVKRATVYATALGVFDLHINGQRVAENRFSPGWTDYTKRVYYRAYDVTATVKLGANALGAVLGDGWYSGYIGWGKIRDHYGKNPRFRALLHVEYADGSTGDVVTDESWKVATGPIREADFLEGETYDATQSIDGWDTPAFNAANWSKVDVGENEVKPRVQWHPGPAVKPFQELKAKSTKEPKAGVYVLDMGQNFAGIVRLKLDHPAKGQKITLRFAERLNPDGTIYTANLREARVIDTYIARGDATETWEPRFTFHGFQYVEVTGLTSQPSAETVTGVAISSDTPVVGAFECSDPMLNQLHSNIYWTQRSNFIDIPTDCPQRDERLGWTGDAQVYVATATLNADVHAFFTKWLVDLCQDGQRADGQFPMVAPIKVAGDDGGPAWQDAGVICPWTIYYTYDDKRLLERHYPQMTKFIAFCEKRSTKDLLPPAQFHAFGDWLSINADTPKEIIYEAYFAHSTKLVAQAAEALGKAEDAKRYNELFDRIKAAFNNAYVKADGRIHGNTQTCYVLAIAFDLLDAEKTNLAAKYLVEDIEKRGNHLSTGFIGTKDLMLALAKVGRNDVAYRLLHNDSFPSWGFSIRHGATSIWERWDGWTPEKGFQDPGMNSFAHYSFGAVYQWMFENIGGIRATSPGYRTFIVAPHIDDKLTHAKVSYGSPHGPIESSWSVKDGKFALDVVVPPNTTAKVVLPGGAESEAKSVGSGTHHFETTATSAKQ
jgi:alpha-L-rhamnosidase